MWCEDCDEREAEWQCSKCGMEQPFRMCNSCSQRCKRRRHELKKIVRTKIFKEHVSQLDRVASIVRAQRAELAEQERETMKIYNHLVEAQEKLCQGAGTEGARLFEKYFEKFKIQRYCNAFSDPEISDETKESSSEEFWTASQSLRDTIYSDPRYHTSAVLTAAAQGDLVELKKLRELKVNLFVTDYDNRTALHLAASEGHYDVVEFLASVAKQVHQLYPRDRWNNTPIEDARRNGFIDIEMVLKNYLNKLSLKDQQESERSWTPFSINPERGFFTQNQKRALDAYLRKETIEIMVLGEVNSGKSTFINALLEVTSMCPMNQLACTSALTRVRYGEVRRCRLVYFDRKKRTLGRKKIVITHWIDIPNDNTLSSLIACRGENGGRKTNSIVQDQDSFFFNFTKQGQYWFQHCLERKEQRSQMPIASNTNTGGSSDEKEDIWYQSGQESEELSNGSSSIQDLGLHWPSFNLCSNVNVLDLGEDEKIQKSSFNHRKATQTLLNSSTFEEFQYVVELKCPSMMLKHGLEIIDSPGMNESQTLTATVEKMIEQVDGVIYILDGGRGTITEKDRHALEFLKESMSKMKTSFDCAFVVNRIDIWEETETVEENLDAFYQKLRDFMIKPCGRSTHQEDIQERWNQIFPEDRRDCDVFHGLSAKRAYGDGDFKVKHRRPKRFIEFERIFSTKLRNRLEIRMLEAVGALVHSINFCYTVFVDAESTNLLLDTLHWCTKLSKELQENVFPELTRYLNELQPEYGKCVSNIINKNKVQWISNCSKSTEFSDIYTVGKRKEIVSRKLMGYICQAFTANAEFQKLIERTRSELKNLTTIMLEKNFITSFKKRGDSRMVFFQALEKVCFDSFHGHYVELFTAARTTFSKVKCSGKKWYHRMRTGFKTEQDVMKWFLDGKGFSKRTFVKYLLQPFREAISIAQRDCSDVWKNYTKLSKVVGEFLKQNLALSHIQDHMAVICAKTLEIGKSIIAVTKDNILDGDQKEAKSIQQPKLYQNKIIEKLVLECEGNMEMMVSIGKEVHKNQSWYFMSFEQSWKLSAYFEELNYVRVEGEGQTEKVKNQRTYHLAPLDMSPRNSVLKKFTTLVTKMFDDHSSSEHIFSRAEFVRNEFLEETFVNQVKIFQHRRSEKLGFRKSGTKVEPCMRGTQEKDKQKFLGHLKEKFLQKTDKNLKSFEILLMWHGSTEDKVKANSKVHNILQCGLADYANQDQGWFGRGVYSTSYSGYAARYSMNGNKPNSEGEYVMLLCAVVVGNVYIISRETDYRFKKADGKIINTNFCRYDYRYPDGKEKLGIAIKAGYDAHYACLSKKLGYQVPPCNKADDIDVDELVVKSETQILPICKVYFKHDCDN